MVLAFCAVCFAPAAQASSTDLFGMGARGAAMGGAVVSNTTGYSAVYYNPAALMILGQRQFSVGVQRADYSISLNDENYAVDANTNLVLGFNVPIPFGDVLADRIALGFGFVVPFQSILEADVRAPETPFFVVVENRAQVIGLHAALGVRIMDWLHVGAGVVALAELIGGIDIAPNNTGQLGSAVRDELVADFALIAGLLVDPVDWLGIGVTYHGASDARFAFPITADLGPSFPVEVPLLNIVGVAQYDPMQVSADITFRPIEGLEIAAGATFKRWSEFINSIERTTPTVPEQDPPLFEDIWVPRLGAEYSAAVGAVTLAGRVGGFYEPTPVPDQTGNNNYLDSGRIGLGFGGGAVWRELTFDLAVQVQLMQDRTHDKSPDLVRDEENAGFPNISHGGSVILSVFEMGVAF